MFNKKKNKENMRKLLTLTPGRYYEKLGRMLKSIVPKFRPDLSACF